MPRMLYHDDPDWYERPGETVDIPLGPALTRSRAFVVGDLPWKREREIPIETSNIERMPDQKQPKQYQPRQSSVDREAIDFEALTRDQPATDLTRSQLTRSQTGGG